MKKETSMPNNPTLNDEDDDLIHDCPSDDDDFDDTYATYEFNVPEKWKPDFDLIVAGKIKEVSDEYVAYVKEFYPLLAEKGVIDVIFRASDVDAGAD